MGEFFSDSLQHSPGLVSQERVSTFRDKDSDRHGSLIDDDAILHDRAAEDDVQALSLAGDSELSRYGRWGGSHLAAERGLLKLLKKFGLEKADLRICYEAGPTGFVLARRLLRLGYSCIIVAPSAVPKKPGERIKTDRRETRTKLARLRLPKHLHGLADGVPASSRLDR